MASERQTFMDSRGPWLAGLVAAMVVAFIAWSLDRVEAKRFHLETQADCQSRLSTTRAHIEGLLNQRLYIVRALEAHVVNNPAIDQDEFSRLAAILMAEDASIRSMTLIQNNVISHVHPLEENRSALGLEIMRVPEQREAAQRAIDLGQSWLAGPVDLVQGGVAFVNRVPIFIGSSRVDDQQGTYWGLASILIDAHMLYAEIDAKSQASDLDIALRGNDASGASGEPFHGSRLVYDQDPLRQTISLPTGSWELAGVPEGGWPAKSPNAWAIRIVGAVLAFCVGMLVCQLLRANAKHRQAQQAALEASRAKSDFLATMSHEIRTPMNAILGMTELVLDSELERSQRDYLKMVSESGETLLALINDILDFSKIEAGKLTLEQIPFSVSERVGDVMKSLAVRAHAKNLELACQIDTDVPAQLVGDPARLGQVLYNLVGNATKFTDQGEIVLNVKCDQQTKDEVVVHFSVRDTGIGIKDDKLAAIFDAFTQADASTTRRHGGTGLGLAISARLVRLMGGRIWAESQSDHGSTFHFTVPMCVSSETVAVLPLAKSVVVEDARLLIVDDNATNRIILQDIASSWGMRVTAVADAQEAIQILRRENATHDPVQLLITDVNMPDVDGITLVEWIRHDDLLQNLPVITLTSGARSDDRERLAALNVTASLMKPAKRSELFGAVCLGLGHGVELAEQASKPVAALPSLPRLRILLAEDSLMNQKLAVGLLEKHGHHVTVANNGLEAIAALADGVFDAVLMDVEMPEMDGLEATEVIREQERKTGAHVPLIAMTAHAMEGDEQRCLDAGMDGYVPKPIRAQHLFEVIESLL